MINRPRNRQPRPPRNNNNHNNQQHNNNRQIPRNNPPQYSPNIPTTQQVRPGTSVSIILKADQPTGRQVQGIVQDLLTRGNHPRGIKVRLRDGRIGRVQRVIDDSGSNAAPEPTSTVSRPGMQSTASERVNSARQIPASRSPALPDSIAATLERSGGMDSPQRVGEDARSSTTTATVLCPICGEFEGDEAAVSHHVQTHLD